MLSQSTINALSRVDWPAQMLWAQVNTAYVRRASWQAWRSKEYVTELLDGGYTFYLCRSEGGVLKDFDAQVGQWRMAIETPMGTLLAVPKARQMEDAA